MWIIEAYQADGSFRRVHEKDFQTAVAMTSKVKDAVKFKMRYKGNKIKKAAI